MNLMICDFCLQKKENITPIGLKIVVISTPCLFAFQLLLTHCCWCWCRSGGERSTEDGRWRKSFVSLLDNWIRPTDQNMDVAFAYSFGFSLVIVAVIITMAVASYYYTRKYSGSETSNGNVSLTTTGDIGSSRSVVIEVIGLNEAALHRFPKLLYSQTKLNKASDSTTSACCSICLPLRL
ncbi:putative RING-H2 finger protein ATL71 [Carya illinoinensis]|uniref:putative RING-H2 finger protein ATL71 n=1 Tax=Carya illinoinensis TaxID=32201 RepID=UPI001C718AC3|nr:putative RING-H2 finger protein ATL71 [Carya illinoinensis]